MLNAKRVFAGLTLLSFLMIGSTAFGQKVTKSKRRKNARRATVVAVPQANSPSTKSTSTETAVVPTIIRLRKRSSQIDVTQLSGGLGQTKTLTAPSAGTNTTSTKSLKAPSPSAVIY